MEIIWKGSPNFTKGRQNNPVNLIIIHWFGVGTLESANNRFQNELADASAHYGISGKKVYQWVKEEDAAWHAGDYPINLRSIGIEHDATTTKNASDDTYETSAQLIAEISNRWNIPLDREHIKGHKEIVPTQCPGTLDLERIIKRAKELSVISTECASCKDYEKKLYDIRQSRDKWKKDCADKDKQIKKLEEAQRLSNESIENLQKFIRENKPSLRYYSWSEIQKGILEKMGVIKNV